MKKWLTSAALAASIAALAAPAVAAPPSTAPSGPPTTIRFDDVALSGCDFKVTADITGKTKEITLPSGGLIVTAPNQTATVTNEKTGETAEFVITGVFFITTDKNDNITFKARGRNLLTRSDGIFLTSGNVSFSFDADGNVLTEFSKEGPGTIIDVCQVLS
jgi:hypothetical protein